MSRHHSDEAVDRLLASLLAAVTPAPRRHRARPVQTSAQTADLVERLQAANSVAAADQILAQAERLDWPGLALAHRASPFDRVQRRALIGRADCPQTMTAALLDRFDPLVAGRTSPDLDVFATPHGSRADRYPPQVVLTAVSRVGEVRHAFFHHALLLGGFPAERMLAATRRLDLLAAVFARESRWSHPAVDIFWPALGVLLRARLGARAAAWWFVATHIAGHRGGLDSLVRRALTAEISYVDTPELQVLAQAPSPVIAELLDGWPDPVRDQLTTVPPWWVHPRAALARHALAAGARARAEYAQWIREAHDGGPDVETVVQLLPLAAGTMSPADLALRTRWDLALRRRLARLRPGIGQPPAALIPALYRCTDPVDAEAVLTAALPDHARIPWSRLVAAHAALRLPEPVLCALADRAGFPPALAAALPTDVLVNIGRRSRVAALQALARNPMRAGFLWDADLNQLLANGVVTITDVFDLLRPARAVLAWALTPVHTPDDQLPDLGLPPPHQTRANAARTHALIHDAARVTLSAMCARAAAGNPERLGHELIQLLPTFTGTVSDLLNRGATFPDPPAAGKPPCG